MSLITDNTQLIVNALRQGKIVALPTETVYGLAADATQEPAIKNIFHTKSRPLNHPLIMHVAPHWDLTQWVSDIPQYAQRLINHFWPGPLTLVFRLKMGSELSALITGGQQTIALRSPAHPMALAVLNELGHPIVAPSANPFGKISPTEAQHVLADFPNHDFLILDGGPCDVGIESTIVEAIDIQHCRVLRHGVISQSELERFCDILETHQNIPRVSGHLKSHYQPLKPLYYFDSRLTDDVLKAKQIADESYTLCFTNILSSQIVDYQFKHCPKDAAKAFYRQIRIADQSANMRLLIELPSSKKEWQGLTERIKKAGRSVSQYEIK